MMQKKYLLPVGDNLMQTMGIVLKRLADSFYQTLLTKRQYKKHGIKYNTFRRIGASFERIAKEDASLSRAAAKSRKNSSKL